MKNHLAKSPSDNTLFSSEGVDLGEYLTLSQFCDYFTLNEQTVRRWLREGQLPGLRIGRAWRIHKDTVAKIESGELVISESEGESDEGADG